MADDTAGDVEGTARCVEGTDPAEAGAAGRAFAARLDALRAGSGRSYGSLARRVGVGAATLHRYCTGRTVPMEFAPVERLARFCGCAGAEIVELHRLWLMADEDRRRRMEPGTGRARTAAAGGSPDGASDGSPAGDAGAGAAAAEASSTGAVADDGPSVKSPGTGAAANGPSVKSAGTGAAANGPGTDAAADGGPSVKNAGTVATADGGPSVKSAGTGAAANGPGTDAAAGGPGTGAAADGLGADAAADGLGAGPDKVSEAFRPQPGGAAAAGAGGEAPVALLTGPPPPAATARPALRRRGGGRVRGLRKPVALALAVAAVPAALGLVAGARHLASGQGGDTAPRPGAPAPAGAPAPPSGPAPSASPSPGTRTVPPAADGERRTPGKGGTAGTADAGAAAGSASAGPGTGPAVPLTWTADDHVWQNGCDHAYLLGRSPGTVPPPPVAADAASWAGALGAVHGGRTMVRVTLQGKGTQAVVVEGVDVRVVQRQGPRPLGEYRMSAGCGGALTPRLFDVDLDRRRPVARPRAGSDSGVPLPAVSFPYAVSATEPESLLVSARTAGCDCSWYLEVRWSSGGRGGTVRVDDGGRPFRTSGTGGGTAYDYDYARRAWVADTPGRAGGSPEPDGADGPRGGNGTGSARDGNGADGTGGVPDGG